jgi:4-amino-4-deoxy-L-arabinose transferase-like glycosyltransferase
MFRITAALDRLLDALIDARRRERTALAVLGGYALAWSLYAAIAKSSQDIHFDMGEAVVWSRDALTGNPKHPPLSAWPVGLWFKVFPQADWAYYALAIVLATVALWAAWRMSAHYLTPQKRVAGLALLTLVPFFNFHALKYNANSVMIPLWALATWAFLRAFETRKALAAAASGLTAAAAMLGKYWSVILLGGLGIAALLSRRRAAYFRSAAPWITMAIGAVALAPHVAWLLNQGTTFSYALESHPGTYVSAFRSGLVYLGGALAYAAPAVLMALVATQPSRAALIDTVMPAEDERRVVAVAFWAPLLLPIIAAVAAQSRVVALWSIGGLSLLPVILLSSPKVTVTRAMARGVLGVALVVPFAALAASPFVAYAIHRHGLDNYAAHYALVAEAVEQKWRNATGRPLKIFGSYDNLLYATSFYLNDHPRTFEIVTPRTTPWTTAQDVARDGIAMVCPVDHSGCMNALTNLRTAPSSSDDVVELRRTWMGIPGAPERFAIRIVPPAQ